MQKTKTKLEPRSKVLEGLNEAQIKAVTYGEGPLLIVAGAGTGKTTVITKRIAYLIEQGIKTDEILALAFGDKAAAEMGERVDQILPYGYYNLQVSTFHSFGEQILREHGLELGLPDFKVLDEVGQWLLVRQNLEKFNLDYYRPLGNPTRFVKALVTHFARAKDELITPEEYLGHAEGLRLAKDEDPSTSLRSVQGEKSLGPKLVVRFGSPQVEGRTDEIKQIQEVANAYHVYQKLLLGNNALDFGDLINYSLELFKRRPQILSLYQKRFKYILIDEFQDTNFAQYELIKLLVRPRNNLTVVGDDDQSIFKFRGASISNILHFQKDYPQASFISLTENYRSGQKILNAARKFIRQNDPDRLEVRLKISKKLINTNDPDGEIIPILCRDYMTEAREVIERIVALKSSNSDLTWDDFAILARSHDSLGPFLSVLEENDIPHIYFANRGLYRKKVILDILAYFKLLDNYHESQALYRVLNFPIYNISHEAIVELSHFAKKKSLSLFEATKQGAAMRVLDEKSISGIEKFHILFDAHLNVARQKSAEQVFIAVVNDLDFAKIALEDYQNGKFLENFRRRIQDFQVQNHDKSLKNFIRELLFEQEAGGLGQLEFDTEAGPEAVKLMTVHGAKGLEFSYVFVVGMVDKRFPSVERKDPIEIPRPLIKDILPVGDIHLEEERRLFYVAMTRAKKALFLSRALDYGGKLEKKPSRFLMELGFTAGEASRPTGKVIFLEPQKERKTNLPLPKSFSFTQISVFRKCPLEYKYRYVLKLPIPGQASLSFGQTVHNTLEKFLRFYKQRQEQRDLFGEAPSTFLPDFNLLQKLYRESWIDDWYESKKQMEEYREKGVKILKFYYEDMQKEPPRPKYLEQRFKLKLGQYHVDGKIDRADETPEGLVVIDYKTGTPRGIFKVDREQLLLYQWATQEFLKEKVANLQYWFLWDKLTKESFLGDDEDIDELQKDFLATITEIAEATKNNVFYDRDVRVSHECKYRDLEI